MTAWVVVVVAWALAASVLHMRDRRRVVMAARAGHEVRGPLSTARLALEGLERSARVQAIDLELQRAALALDDLAGVRRRPEPRRVVDVADVLLAAREAWAALAAAHDVALLVDPRPAPVLVNPLRLTQACTNLVANAIEHGGGAVRVRTIAGGGRVRIEVTDSGPGLPAPVSELIAAARGRRSARGHGLAIAAAIAERHGGRLTSAPAAHGARLVLDLPLVPGPPPPTTAAAGTPRQRFAARHTRAS